MPRYVPERSAAPLSDVVGGGAAPYRRGYQVEAAAMGRLRRRGYFVQRAHGSKGIVDLLAVSKVTASLGISALMIQCKRSPSGIGSADWNLLCATAWDAGGWPVVCFRPSPREMLFYRCDKLREFRKPGRPWTAIDVADCREYVPAAELFRL